MTIESANCIHKLNKQNNILSDVKTAINRAADLTVEDVQCFLYDAEIELADLEQLAQTVDEESKEAFTTTLTQALTTFNELKGWTSRQIEERRSFLNEIEQQITDICQRATSPDEIEQKTKHLLRGAHHISLFLNPDLKTINHKFLFDKVQKAKVACLQRKFDAAIKQRSGDAFQDFGRLLLIYKDILALKNQRETLPPHALLSLEKQAQALLTKLCDHQQEKESLIDQLEKALINSDVKATTSLIEQLENDLPEFKTILRAKLSEKLNKAISGTFSFLDCQGSVEQKITAVREILHNTQGQARGMRESIENGLTPTVKTPKRIKINSSKEVLSIKDCKREIAHRAKLMQNKNNPLLTLPKELLTHIIRIISPSEFLELREVCRSFKQCIDEDILPLYWEANLKMLNPFQPGLLSLYDRMISIEQRMTEPPIMTSRIISKPTKCSSLALAHFKTLASESEAADIFRYLGLEEHQAERSCDLLTRSMWNTTPFVPLPKTPWELKLWLQNPVNIDPLRTLRISYGHGVNYLPNYLEHMIALRTLSVSSTPLRQLPESISRLVNLENLSIEDAPIASLGYQIESLTALQILNLRRLKITQLPPAIYQLQQLRELDVSGSPISNLPTHIGVLRALEQLTCFGCSLTSVPESLGRLPALSHLSLGRNPIEEFPPSLNQLTSLRSLSLAETNVAQVPKFVRHLTNLTDLNLEQTAITRLPKFLANLTQLTTLGASNSQFQHIPDEVLNAPHLQNNWVIKQYKSEHPR